jgi:hypothetical protein
MKNIGQSNPISRPCDRGTGSWMFCKVLTAGGVDWRRMNELERRKDQNDGARTILSLNIARNDARAGWKTVVVLSLTAAKDAVVTLFG